MYVDARDQLLGIWTEKQCECLGVAAVWRRIRRWEASVYHLNDSVYHSKHVFGHIYYQQRRIALINRYQYIWLTISPISLACLVVCRLYKVLHLKPNGAHGVLPLPRPCRIPPIPAAFMRTHGLAVCTLQYCTGHQHEQAIDSTAVHFHV